MDNYQRAYYDVKFLAEFLKRNATEFQTFFEEIMEKGYPGDFQRVRPWGNLGDRKNDGYLKSKRCLFQVYAPNDMNIRKALTKIDTDFRGALPYWRQHFDTWTFVHNAYHGLAPDILDKLLSLEVEHAPLKIERVGFEELRREVFQMDAATITSLLGPAPSVQDMMRLGMKDLKPVLINIARHRPILSQEIRPVPPDKLYSNDLSDSVEDLLKLGMQKAWLVQQFFDKWHDPTLGESVAQAFTDEYVRLKEEDNAPDQIFWKLQIFAGGERMQDPSTLSSVLAVIAYLFERCHIYESSRMRVES
jgi:hypothetical protein